MVMVRKVLWVGMPIEAILTIALWERSTHPMCCVRTRMEIYLLDMLAHVMDMLIEGAQFVYLNLSLLMLGVLLPNGLLNPIIDFVGLFLRWAIPPVGYSSDGPKWLFDSGCTNHMTGGREVLEQFVEDVNSTQCILFGDNSKGKVLGRGKLATSRDLSLENVMLVDTLGYNLLSILHLASISYDC
jgi:hypothetical protein